VARTIDPAAKLPSRNPLAYVLAIFVPYTGRAGGGALALLVVVAVIGILAAVAMPAYQEYQSRTVVSKAWTDAAPVRETLGAYYKEKQEIPDSLEAAGAPQTLPDGSALKLDPDTMVLEVETAKGTLRMEPSAADDGIAWHCIAGDDLPAKALPIACRK
jgi:type II secretory pathway pseudopilin PulG